MKTGIWKNILQTTAVCVVVCLVCEIGFLGLLEHGVSVSGMGAMYLAMFLASLLSCGLQATYVCVRSPKPFFHTAKMFLLMVVFSMIGMGIAEWLIHTAQMPMDHDHHAHHGHHHVEAAMPLSMFDAMRQPFSLFLMFAGGMLTLLPYNYFQIKKHGNLH